MHIGIGTCAFDHALSADHGYVLRSYPIQ
jgi:hypothetical protein